MLAENESQRAKAQAALRMAQGYLGTADRAVRRAYESMIRARESEKQRASVGYIWRGPYEKQRDEARLSAQLASDDAVNAANRIEEIATALIDKNSSPSDTVSPSYP